VTWGQEAGVSWLTPEGENTPCRIQIDGVSETCLFALGECDPRMWRSCSWIWLTVAELCIGQRGSWTSFLPFRIGPKMLQRKYTDLRSLSVVSELLVSFVHNSESGQIWEFTPRVTVLRTITHGVNIEYQNPGSPLHHTWGIWYFKMFGDNFFFIVTFYVLRVITLHFYFHVNLLKTKRNLLYIRSQSVPRCKHFPPRL